MTQRAKVLTELADLVLAVERPHPVRVAIDGCSAAGKTTLADELADVLRERTEREVIRAGVDHFKRAVELRTAYPVRRGTARDQQWMSSAEAAERRYRTKYIPGERLYVDQIRPHARAQILVNNQDPAAPTLTVQT